MAKTSSILANRVPEILLVPALLSLLVQLYRWWLQLRRRQKHRSVDQAIPRSNANAAYWNFAESGRSHSLTAAPLPRPGFDDDTRLAPLDDDPRYFEGAEIGKAQRAAMGEKGLVGTNTVSFDPTSTLVRPAMRVLYGQATERHEHHFRPDDVILVPQFGCSEEDQTCYWKLVDEISEVGMAGGEDPRKLPLCAQMVSRLCSYFSLLPETCSVSLTWYRQGQDPAVFQGKAGCSAFDCEVSLCFGDPGELHFESAGLSDRVHLSCDNGCLILAAVDVDLQWMQTAPEHPWSHCTCGGQVLITVCGSSPFLTKEVVDRPLNRASPTWSCPPRAGFSRPSMRIMTVQPSLRYSKPVSHDDAIIVPGFFCAEDNWDIYYQLLQEMRENQSQGEARAEWVSWHEGSHLLTKNPESSKTYQRILERLREYFGIVNNHEQGSRFNWYRDGSDWKPFHHDSAAFNQQRAMLQNCTLGISFGASRELAFRHAKSGELIYIPQNNGMLFFFGRDVNIRWQHAINALPLEEQNGKGRVSIVLWGLCSKTVEEEGSPPMLSTESRSTIRQPRGSTTRLHSGSLEPSQGACRNFQKFGDCRFGDRCRYSHGPAANGRKW